MHKSTHPPPYLYSIVETDYPTGWVHKRWQIICRTICRPYPASKWDGPSSCKLNPPLQHRVRRLLRALVYRHLVAAASSSLPGTRLLSLQDRAGRDHRARGSVSVGRCRYIDNLKLTPSSLLCPHISVQT